MRPRILPLVMTLCLAGTARAEAPFSFSATPGDLPKTARPLAYSIDITPDLKTLRLQGEETVEVEVLAPTDALVLNQAGLKLTSAVLDRGERAAIAEDQKAQTATLSFTHVLARGRHTLRIVYDGPILTTPNGIYADDYKTTAGAGRRMLVTQFEVADARRMFPCWDEPAFKATFQLSSFVPKGLAAVSNTPAVSTTREGAGGVRVRFARTPRMSTYLLALLEGDFGAVRGTAAGVAMSAYAPADRAGQGAYALSVEEKVLPYYNAYFATPYPLPKLDLVAVPGNYEAGAMENWGAITFIDDAMLLDPRTSAPQTKEEIFLVVAHEMAHQWSGDLVTLAWWNDVWLNEGFATWMENKATAHFNPDWEVIPREHADREQAMATDAQPGSHAIQQPIKDASEANAAFDSISYQKGGQVIRMIEDWLSPDVFRDGMRLYMRAHAYSNATSADLWAALKAASGRDVAAVAQGFTQQPGIPLVEVSRSCVDGRGALSLRQERFSAAGAAALKPLTWTIPVSLGEPGGAPRRIMLSAESAKLPLSACDAPVKVNLGENGYYRVAYDPRSLSLLKGAFESLGSADRANLLGDQFALFIAGRGALADYLSLVGKLRGETNIAVWTDTLAHLKRLDQALEGSPQRGLLDAYAVSVLRPEFARLGWEPKPQESFLDALLRPEVIAALGQFQDAEVLKEARRRFDAFVADPTTLPPALRAPVLEIVGRTADLATWRTLKELGERATSTEEKLRYFFAMAGASDPALLGRNVDFALSGAVPSGRITAFLSVASTRSGHPDELVALVADKERAFEALTPSDGLAPTALASAAVGSSNPETARRVLDAPVDQASNGARVNAARIAGAIRTNADLRARVSAEIARGIAEAGPAG